MLYPLYAIAPISFKVVLLFFIRIVRICIANEKFRLPPLHELQLDSLKNPASLTALK